MKRVTVLFENDDCLILNKPAGLAVQGGKGVGISLDVLLAGEWSPQPLLVHRLDKDTSGLILAAKTPQTAARFSALFAGEKGSFVHKHYLAVCAGRPERTEARIEAELEIRDRDKYSETSYRVASCKEGFSLLELELKTGRMHQIRRHLALIGHPVLGDGKYGNFALNKEIRRTRGLNRLLLHASRLVISAAALGYPLDVQAPLPDYFSPFI